jgi:hypothetical protein
MHTVSYGLPLCGEFVARYGGESAGEATYPVVVD